jgi:hypothetical protein
MAQKVLRIRKIGFSIGAERAPQLLGLDDLHDVAIGSFQSLIIARE